MPRTYRLPAALLAGIVMLSLTAALALAHSHYVGSNPADGALVAKAPAQVVVGLEEEVSLQQSYIVVVDANGKPVDKGDGHVDPDNRTQLIASLPATLPDGVYQIRWHGVTPDDNGQTWGGVQFRVGAGAAPDRIAGSGDTQEVAPIWATLYKPSGLGAGTVAATSAATAAANTPAATPAAAMAATVAPTAKPVVATPAATSSAAPQQLPQTGAEDMLPQLMMLGGAVLVGCGVLVRRQRR